MLTSQLLEEARDEACRARLLASASKESGAWLHALPVTSLGLRLDDDSVSIAVGVRLGVPVCGPTHVTIVEQTWMPWVDMGSAAR